MGSGGGTTPTTAPRRHDHPRRDGRSGNSSGDGGDRRGPTGGQPRAGRPHPPHTTPPHPDDGSDSGGGRHEVATPPPGRGSPPPGRPPSIGTKATARGGSDGDAACPSRPPSQWQWQQRRAGGRPLGPGGDAPAEEGGRGDPATAIRPATAEAHGMGVAAGLAAAVPAAASALAAGPAATSGSKPHAVTASAGMGATRAASVSRMEPVAGWKRVKSVRVAPVDGERRQGGSAPGKGSQRRQRQATTWHLSRWRRGGWRGVSCSSWH